MDGTLAVQDGLSEDGPSGVTSAHPDALHTPLGSPAPPDQWDEGRCQSPAPPRAAGVLPEGMGETAFTTVVNFSLRVCLW